MFHKELRQKDEKMFGMEETNMADIVDGVSHVCRQLTLKTDDSTYLKYLN